MVGIPPETASFDDEVVDMGIFCFFFPHLTMYPAGGKRLQFANWKPWP